MYEYKEKKSSQSVDWESVRSKYEDIIENMTHVLGECFRASFVKKLQELLEDDYI